MCEFATIVQRKKTWIQNKQWTNIHTQTPKNKGLRLFIPAIQQMYKVDLRTRVHELASQQIITKDNVSCSVNAVVYFHVDNPKDAILKVDNVDSGFQFYCNFV